jgi:hypothetical protein
MRWSFLAGAGVVLWTCPLGGGATFVGDDFELDSSGNCTIVNDSTPNGM